MSVLRVLIIEGSEEEAELMVLELKRAGYQVVHKRIRNREQMLESLREQEWSLVLCDCTMPDFSGLEALDIWKQHGSDRPFIIVSGTIGDELAVEAMRSGAHDYVLKTNLKKLGPVVDRALRDADERRLRREAEESLRRAMDVLLKSLSSQRDAVLVLDMNDPPRIVDMNPATTEVFGYSREELVGQLAKILHVDEARYGEFCAIVVRGMREQGYSQLAFKMRRKDRSVFPSEHVVTPILGDGGVRSGFVSVVRDVSSREAAKESLRESESGLAQRLRELDLLYEVTKLVNEPDINPDEMLKALVSLLPQGVRYSENAGARVIIQDKTISTPGFHETDLRISSDILLKGEKVGSVEICYLDGIPDSDEATFLNEEKGMLDSIAKHVGRAIEERQAETALAASEVRYRQLAKDGRDVVFRYRLYPKKGVEYVSPESFAMLGYSPEEYYADPELIVKTTHPEDQAWVELLLQDIQLNPTMSTVRMIHKNGNVVWVERRIGPAFDESGAPIGIQWVSRDVTERRQTEEALKASEERYRQLAENAKDIILRIRVYPALRIEYVNSVSETMLGYTPQEFYADSRIMFKIVHPDDRATLQLLFQNPPVSPVTLNLRWIRRDGSVVWTEQTVITVLYESGKPIVLQTIGRDITERRKSEQALEASEELFRGIFSNSPVAINVFDSNGYLTAANEALLRFAGVTSVEDMREFNIFTDPNFSEEMRERLKRGETVLYESSVDFSKVREQGSYPTSRHGVAFIQSGISPLRLGGDSSIHGYLVQLIDITERKKAEEALRESVELFRTTVESAADGILVTDSTGQVRHANPRLAEMWGIPIDTILAMNWPEILGWLQLQLENHDELTSIAETLDETSRVGPFTITFRSGTTLGCYSFPMKQNQESVGRVWSFRDVTQLKRAEESATLYLDLMGHDIRNQLQGMSAGIDLLELKGTDGDSTVILDEIRQTINRCAGLISKVKATEHMSEIPLTVMSLGQEVRRVADIYKTLLEGASVEVSPIHTDAYILADHFLSLLLTNIIENAIQHNPRKEKRVWIQLLEGNREYELSIADNGPGIKDDRKRQLFDRGRRFGGVGLHQALYIAYKYGGRIEARDRVLGDPSQGADFHIWFPKQVDMQQEPSGKTEKVKQ